MQEDQTISKLPVFDYTNLIVDEQVSACVFHPKEPAILLGTFLMDWLEH